MSLICNICNRKKPFPDVETFMHHIETSKKHKENLRKMPQIKKAASNSCEAMYLD